MLAAVIPFPREEVTPPVTKTYFATEQTSGGFSNAIEDAVPGQPDSVRLYQFRTNRVGTNVTLSASARAPRRLSSVAARWLGTLALIAAAASASAGGTLAVYAPAQT